MVYCWGFPPSPAFSIFEEITIIEELSMRKIIFSLLASAAVLLPGAAYAQSYEQFPQSVNCPVVISRVCHGTMPDGSPILYAIPTGYGGQFVLTATRVGQGYLIFMYDGIEDQVAAYMYVDENAILMPSLNGRPSYGGNINMLSDISEEFVDILIAIKAYY